MDQPRRGEALGEMVVTRGLQRSLQVQFERTRQRPPTAEEAQALVNGWVREEVLYREGLAFGPGPRRFGGPEPRPPET